MNFIKKFFLGEKKEYIGLSSFKKNEDIKPEIKKEIKAEKTSLTGILRKVS